MTVGAGTLVGPYRLERLLGRGGMAVVYEATHESIGRTVALKLVSSDLSDPQFLERFREEGRMQAALDHPHAVTVYEAGTSEHGPYLAMRLVRGTTLAGLIDDGALSADRTLDLLQQVAEALDAAHAAGVVHRDVKPRNILVGDEDHAFLADFGLTRRTDTQGVTVTGHFMGTLAYVAPEVVLGEVAGPAADRYALAAVLFECLTGTGVFPRSTHAAVLFAHTNEPPPRVSGRRDGVPPGLDDVLIAGLAKDPAQRPATAVALIAAARAALAGHALGPPAPRVLPLLDDATTSGQTAQPAAAATSGARSGVTPGRAPEAVRPAPSGGRGPRRAAVVAAAVLVGAALGGGAVAALDGDDTTPAARDPLPAAPAPLAGTERLGSALAATGPGRTVDCQGRPVRARASTCTVFQDSLATATVVVPRGGVVRRWSVRSASGELALTVLRRRDEGYFQVSRSRNEFVGNDGLHSFAADLAVDRGDRLGLVVVEGSGVGLRASPGGTTGRWSPPLAGAIRPQQDGPAGELLLQVDYQPGGKRRLPVKLRGASAGDAPAGQTLATRRARFGNGRPVEFRVALVDGRGVLDLVRGGRRIVRIGVPDMVAPIDPGVRLDVAVVTGEPEHVGIDVEFTRPGSDRLLHHYFDALGRDVYATD
ncbi:serine-threonine kinase [Paraconexibacter sp. AEG42_29]|uniref:non-specific serine/threonine protein kinase n=1 Tax=Paraconexibacter sp. AEG42_29 TaxID=2997339 RepID=A0AAU7ASK8_9ACTN